MKLESKKRTQLLKTSRELFLKHGSKRVTIEEICRKAKVSKVTFYKYFKNKPALISYIGDELMEEGFSRFDEISEMDISYTEKINLMSEWRIDFFSLMNTEFVSEMMSLDTVVEEARSRFLKNITLAQAQGDIKPDISPDLIWLLTEKLNEIGRDGEWKSLFSDYSQFQDQLRTIIFFGLLTSPKENASQKEAQP